MVFVGLSVISAVLALFSTLSSAAPADQLDAREIVARDGQTGPHWVIYSDKWSGNGAPPAASALKGYNVL
jgi:hypothetical protein